MITRLLIFISFCSLFLINSIFSMEYAEFANSTSAAKRTILTRSAERNSGVCIPGGVCYGTCCYDPNAPTNVTRSRIFGMLPAPSAPEVLTPNLIRSLQQLIKEIGKQKAAEALAKVIEESSDSDSESDSNSSSVSPKKETDSLKRLMESNK